MPGLLKTKIHEIRGNSVSIDNFNTYFAIFEKYLEKYPIIWDPKSKELKKLEYTFCKTFCFNIIFVVLFPNGAPSVTFILTRFVFVQPFFNWKLIFFSILIFAIGCIFAIAVLFFYFADDIVFITNQGIRMELILLRGYKLI